MKIIAPLTIFLPLLIIALTGCLPPEPGNCDFTCLSRHLANRQLADRRRLGAINRLNGITLTKEQYCHLGIILQQIIQSPSNSAIIRSRTIDIITNKYPRRAAIWLAQALENTPETNLQDKIIHVLKEKKDTPSLPYLVSFALHMNRPDPLSQKKITSAIESITGKRLPVVLFDEFHRSNTLNYRLNCLFLLQKHLPVAKIIAYITALPDQEPFIHTLQFWASHFDYLPDSKNNYLLCQALPLAMQPGQMKTLQKRYLFLRQRDNYRFALSDTYTLLHTFAFCSNWPRQRLVADIRQRLSHLSHLKRPMSYRHAPDDYREGFVDQHNLLSYTDLVRIRLFLNTLGNISLRHRLNGYLRKDLATVNSEIGGLCFINRQNGEISFKEYDPGAYIGDNRYVESSALRQDAVLSLARWHCHARKSTNVGLAGPGADDLRFAAWYGCPSVVITLIKYGWFNLDYYTPKGIVIDLGNYDD